MHTFQVADVVLFYPTNMVKVKDAGISNSTVHAGMTFQVIPHSLPRFSPKRVIVTLGLIYIILLVVLVVTPPIFQVAFLARLFVLAAPNTEHGQRAKLAAFRAVHSLGLACFLHDSAIVLQIRRACQSLTWIFLDKQAEIRYDAVVLSMRLRRGRFFRCAALLRLWKKLFLCPLYLVCSLVFPVIFRA